MKILKQSDFPDEAIDTNKLSQIVFVTYKGTCICIPGDLTSDAWEKHLKNINVQTKLKQTQIFIASHHGREDGFNENEHRRLAENFRNLNTRSIMVINKTTLTEELYRNFIVGEYDKNYSVNIRNRFKSSAIHLIVKNY